MKTEVKKLIDRAQELVDEARALVQKDDLPEVAKRVDEWLQLATRTVTERGEKYRWEWGGGGYLEVTSATISATCCLSTEGFRIAVSLSDAMMAGKA